MARWSVDSGKVSTGALAAGASKTLLMLIPGAGDGGRIAELFISFGAVAAQADIAVGLYRVVTLGSPAGTAATVTKEDPGNAATSSATALSNLTTEPTTVDSLRNWYIPPNGGIMHVMFPMGREPQFAAGGMRVGLRVINDGAAAMTAINARAGIVWDAD